MCMGVRRKGIAHMEPSGSERLEFKAGLDESLCLNRLCPSAGCMPGLRNTGIEQCNVTTASRHFISVP